MRRFARWHIWLGWLTGMPLLLWTLSGLVMVAKPIEEVRGNHLKRALADQALPASTAPPLLGNRPAAREVRSLVLNGRAVTLVTRLDGTVQRHDAVSGRLLPPVDEDEVRAIVKRQIVGGESIASLRLFGYDHPPFDFRQPKSAWQVTLTDGTHVYVLQATGEIAAVRTDWWRFYDVFWGLHIMDLQTRQDSHHPTLIVFAVLGLAGSTLGTVLLFRRRRAPAKAGASGRMALPRRRSPPLRGLGE